MQRSSGTTRPGTSEVHLARHQFIRLFGRRPTPEELAEHLQASTGPRPRTSDRIRRGAARLVVRL